MDIRKLFCLTITLLLATIANAESVHLSNDTLYCSLAYDEVGTLKSQTSDISDLNQIRTIVLCGYISQADEDFIHTLGKNYNLNNLDMTELHSSMSYQGLEGCTKIKSVKYSKYWTSTVQYLFEDCTNLDEVIFPDDSECSLTTFSSGTFRGCSSLKTISIPAKIKKMEGQLFMGCSQLKEIHCNAGMAPFATKETFGNRFTATIYIPTGAIQNYKTSAGWCLFANYKENPNITYEDNIELKSENVSFSNDTLYCYLTNSETGCLRTSALSLVKDINTIKYAVLDGYLNSDDCGFLNALASAYSLSSLDMTNLKTSFSNYQFQGCTKLTTIKYSRYWNSTGWYLFEDCSNIRNVTFPENVIGNGYKTFETGTFRGCSSLEEITIPSTVTSIGSQCFYVCNKLKAIILKPTNPPSAKEESFGGQFSTAKLIVPKGTKIDYETSSGWSLFKNIEESVDDVDLNNKEISENITFSEGTLCANLPAEEVGRLKATVLAKYPEISKIKKVIIANYLNQDDANFLNALSSSYNLCSIDFTEMKSIFGNYSFQGCAKLTEVKYSKYWHSTGWYLFKDCSSLVDIHFPEDPIGDGMTTFETGSFRGCYALQEIQIPENVTSIGNQCFYLCRNLRRITFLGAKISNIDKGAFEGCYNLETITLPSSITLVGERCFEGCPKLKEIHCGATTPPEASENTFDGIYKSATLYVPKGCREKYAAAPVWKNFSKIEESEVSGITSIVKDNTSLKVVVYNMEGKMVYQGSKMPCLPKGIYIINKFGEKTKVIIK